MCKISLFSFRSYKMENGNSVPSSRNWEFEMVPINTETILKY